jgi:DNA-binding CsgD family transcriptional regulator
LIASTTPGPGRIADPALPGARRPGQPTAGGAATLGVDALEAAALGPALPNRVIPGRALLDLVAADPNAPMCVGVCAPGGYGKTWLLRELERAYVAAGVPVTTQWGAFAEPSPVDAVLLIDDAHLLDDERLRELAQLAGRRESRMVIAYRPWPRPAALAELTDALRRRQPPLVLPPLTADQVWFCLASILGEAASPELAGFVTAQTRGVPRYVARLASALATGGDSGGSRGPVPGQANGGADHRAVGQPRASASAVVAFAADLDGLDRDLHLFLLAVEAGVGLHFDLLASLLDADSEAVGELMEAARATGMLCADGTLVPLAQHAIAVLGPIAHRVGVRQRLAALQLARGGPVLPLVRPLLGVGTGASMGPAFEAAGHEALGDDPALAARLFAAAVAAGRPAAARRALATALAGDLDAASRLADQVVAAGDPAERTDGAHVSAAALAHRGQLARSVELYQWAQDGPAAGFAAVGLVGTGRLAEAQRATGVTAGPARAPAGPPTLLAGAASLMARGVCESVTGSPATALSTLVQAATLLEPAGATVLLPDSPAALAALVSAHCAEFDLGEVLLERAVQSRTGGHLLAARHRLLQGWLAMVRGQGAAARDRLAAADDAGQARLHSRDLLFTAALRVGLARRNSDLAGLRAAWPEASQALVGHPVDLFTLLPLGELVVAAARLGEQRWLVSHLDEADALLSDLGDPPLWSVPLHWSRLHAAIIAEEPDAAEAHATTLARLREHSAYAAAVAEAAQSWLAVLTGDIDPGVVEVAARGLASAGLRWDGARLAGQAAIRTTDRTAMTALLDCARLLQGRPPDRRAAAGNVAGGSGGDGTPGGQERSLSEREQQVADLVLAGLTYKQIGDRLYISAKTVEHHMARMRQRLGCSDRRDLLARLREIAVERTSPTGRSGTEREV